MFSLLNFPYNLKEMMEEEDEEFTLGSLEEKLIKLLSSGKNLSRKKLAAALNLNPDQWNEWLKNATIPPALKSAIKDLPDE